MASFGTTIMAAEGENAESNATIKAIAGGNTPVKPVNPTDPKDPTKPGQPIQMMEIQLDKLVLYKLTIYLT